MKKQNGWTEWSKHVLLELERQNKSQEKMEAEMIKQFTVMRDEIADLRTEIAMMKVKMNIYASGIGLVAGSIASIIVALIV
jgi:hypothetical protein